MSRHRVAGPVLMIASLAGMLASLGVAGVAHAQSSTNEALREASALSLAGDHARAAEVLRAAKAGVD